MYRIVSFKDNNDVTNVMAISSYAGKTVKAVAKCNPEDTFDMDTGIRLAEARCTLKVAEKRSKRAMLKYQESLDALNAAKKRFEDMAAYVVDANDKMKEAKNELDILLEELAENR